MLFSAAYSGAALALRDRLIIEWNKTQQRQSFEDQKRVYCKPFLDNLSVWNIRV